MHRATSETSPCGMSKAFEIALRPISVRPTEVGEELSNVSLICVWECR